MAKLDAVGLQLVWDKILDNFVLKDGDKVLSEVNFSNEYKQKLLDLETSFNETITVDIANLETNKADKITATTTQDGLMSSTDKQKLESITNPMVIKGRVDTVDDLPTTATAGWVYFVGTDGSDDFDEYVYTESETWENIGHVAIDMSIYATKTELTDGLSEKVNTADIDTAMSSTSTNPVQNKVIYESFVITTDEIDEVCVAPTSDTTT